MDDHVVVGRVGRPHGLDGAFVVERASAAGERFAPGAVVYVGGEPATVVLVRGVGSARIAVKLDRTVERGAELTVPRAALPDPGPDTYYVGDLVGLAVEEEGRRIGTVQDVLPGAANDNLELDDGTLVPLIEDAIRDVDLAAGRIVLNPGFTV